MNQTIVIQTIFFKLRFMQKNLLVSYLVCLFLFFSLPGNAQRSSVYNQLLSVNADWQNQPDVPVQLQTEAAKTLNEQQLVQLHLYEVEKLLRSRSIDALAPEQRVNRIKNLDVLHEYLMAGIFPVNTGHYNRQPYFIDDNNNYCAVGYLMKESGADDIARDIHRIQNFSYLKDIHHDKLMHWVQQSGLSFEELALIQPGYGGETPATLTEFHYNNTGKDVNEYIEIKQGTGALIGIPDFKTVLFYNNTGVLYKTLPITEMQLSTKGYPVYYYLFDANENFTDSGKIEIRGQNFSDHNILISLITYNSDSITVANYPYYDSTNPNIFQYKLGESESTTVNTSLTFCGTYPGSWQLSSLPATIGTLNSCIDLIVPIILKSFSFTIKENTVNLSWQTLTETNNKEFDIERSTDGYHFKPIGSVPAAENSSSGRQYNYIDIHPDYTNYYRLKQVDIDGTVSYSKVLYAKVEGASPFILQQTLVNADVRYENKLPTNGARIEIYDITGRKVYSKPAGSGAGSIAISNLANGKYIIRLLAGNGQVYTKQFIKQSV